MYSITQNGLPLDKALYTIDEENKTFSSKESYLVLDFNVEHSWTFKTGSNCTFKTWWRCTFTTGSYCTFDTGWNCIFKTGSDCTLLRYGDKTYRYFLDTSRYVFTEDSLIEIEDKNQAILNMKHKNKHVRRLCKEILKGK